MKNTRGSDGSGNTARIDEAVDTFIDLGASGHVLISSIEKTNGKGGR